MKKPSKDDRLNEALEDLLVALDFVEEAVVDGRCECDGLSGGPHAKDCKPALLIRKYGRKVAIEGDKP